MSSNDPFKILGLSRKEATKTSVKKAYSVKLKETRPDDDPEGFMALRDAYQQALNTVRWQENHADELDTALVNEDAQSPKQKPEEIKYWYDKKLDFHFNSSPMGKLIEKTIRWMREENVPNADAFFETIKQEQLLQKSAERIQYENFLLGRIFYDAGGEDYYEEDEVDEDEEYKKPEWLSDDVIISIHKHFDFLNRQPEGEWDARQLNCVKILFEHVLLKNEIIDKLSDPHDLIEYRAKEIEAYNKDEHGSYYDKQQKKWIDMSPVGVAMRDIENLIKTPWANGSKDSWLEILNRDDLETIDEFQKLDDQLRYFVTNKSGFKGDPTAVLEKPDWLSKEIILLLDDTFGWSHQMGRQMWDHDQYKWLHRIIGEYRTPSTFTKDNRAWQEVDRNSYEFLGYQKLPKYFSAGYIFSYYCIYRVSQAFLRMVF